MYEDNNDNNLLEFLYHSEKRIANLIRRAKGWRSDSFDEYREDLERVIKGATARLYGTKMMQLGHERSHLNIFLDLENSYWTTQNPDNVDTMMKMLEVHLKAEVAKTDAFKPLSGESDAHLLWRGPLTKIKTPVPTIRVLCNKRNTANPNDDKDFLAMNDPNQTRAQRRRANRRRANQRRYDRLQCDITFSSGLGVENTLLIHQMFSLQPEAFKLYHFVRIWIHIDEFCFKRYMVALLVLFYMQNHGLMPSLVDMQKDVAEKFIDGWNVSSNKKKGIAGYGKKVMTNYEDHRVGFFEFYETFDFGFNVICPYLGQAVPIGSYPANHEGLEKYKDNIKSFNRAAVNVADLLNLNFNCAHGVGAKRLKKFQQFCGHAISLLEGREE